MSTTSVLYTEYNEETRTKVIYVRSEGGVVVQAEIDLNEEINKDDCDLNPGVLGVFFRRVFLPAGFPSSVSEDYVSYQVWDTAQAFASSIAGSLSTKAVLEGVGVGDETATPLAATITWLLRTAAGMVGEIVFAFARGSDLDHNCKKWRLFADILNDAAMLVELTAPLWPEWSRQLVLCTAGVCRSLVGVAGGATRAAITQHQAKRNNISDVAAKDKSQETLVNLVAMAANLSILPLVGDDIFLTWLLFLILVIIHLLANYKAVSSLRFRTLNGDRLLTALDNYVKHKRVTSVESANRSESVVLGFGKSPLGVSGRKIALGASFASISATQSAGTCTRMAARLQESPEAYVLLDEGDRVDVILGPTCSSAGVLEAYCAAVFYAIGRADGHDEKFERSCAQNAREFLSKMQREGWNTTYMQTDTLGFKGIAMC